MTLDVTVVAASDVVPFVSPAELRSMLGNGSEVALIDVREELIFSQSHLLLARSVPLRGCFETRQGPLWMANLAAADTYKTQFSAASAP